MASGHNNCETAVSPETSTQEDQSTATRKARHTPGLSVCGLPQLLFGRHLFGFAFLAHELQFALSRFDLGGHFLLHARCRLFEFR